MSLSSLVKSILLIYYISYPLIDIDITSEKKDLRV